MTFHDFTLTLMGEVRSRRVHESAGLAAGAVEIFCDLFERHGGEFRVPVPAPAGLGVELHWSEDAALPGCAFATFYAKGSIVTTSALCAGADPGADRKHLQSLQSLLFHLWRGGSVEPAIDLLSIADRPAIVSVPFGPSPAMSMVADMETCLAAAYFLENLT